MQALVTGGAGFLGSHLVAALVRRRHRVAVVDDLSSGAREHLRGLPVRFVRRSVLDLRPSDLRGTTHLFHLAARASVPGSWRDPRADMAVNAGGTLRLLELCRRSAVERFVYASSSGVYGPPRKIPMAEDHPRLPSSPYGVSKGLGEDYVRIYRELHGLETVALRVFNAYGPRQPRNVEGGAVARFARSLRTGDPIEVRGSGRQTRDFVHVSDVVEAFLRAAVVPGAAGGCFNVGTGRETSILDLAALFRARDPALRVSFRPPVPGDVPRSRADTARARKVLGFRARVSLPEGVARTLAAQAGLPVEPRGRRSRSWATKPADAGMSKR